MGRDPSEIWRTKLGTVLVMPSNEAAKVAIGQRFGAGSIDDLPEEMQEQIRRAMIFGDASTVGEELQSLRDAGLDGIVVNMPGAHRDEHIQAVAEVGLAVFS